MTPFKFQAITTIECVAIENLRKESEEEGYYFISRLINDWQNNTNCFALKGEGFYGVYNGKELIAIGGINQDPYIESDTTTGRLRRFYVKQSWRRQKVGLALLKYIIEQHQNDFNEITLYTDTKAASLFYESIGFEKVSGINKVSHRQKTQILLDRIPQPKLEK